jgi:hypothetical protein
MVIVPDSFTKIIWDLFLLIIIFIDIFYIPLKISFNIDHILQY